MLRWHPAAMDAYEQLAAFDENREDYQEARDLYQKALQVAERTRNNGKIEQFKKKVADLEMKLNSKGK